MMPLETQRCHIRINELKSGKVTFSSGHAGESTFLSGGFWKWKASLLYKSAVHAVITVHQTCSDIGVMLSKAHASDKLKNREYVFQVFQNIHFLARQGKALHGD